MSDFDKRTGFEPMLGGEADPPTSGQEPSLPGDFVVLKTLLMDDLGAIPLDGLSRFERMQAIRQRGKAALPALLELCGHDNPRVRHAAIKIAGWIGEAEAIPALSEAIQSSPSEAASALVDIGPASVPVLLPLLNDPDRRIRIAAANALGLLRSKEAVPGLVNILQEETENFELIVTARALRRIGDRSALPALEAIAHDPEKPNVDRFFWWEVFMAIYVLGAPEKIDLLLKIFPAVQDSRRILRLLGQTQDQRVLPVLLQALQSPRFAFRTEATIQGLMYFDDSRLIREIEPFLRSHEPRVRQAAEIAIRRLERSRPA